MTYYNQTHTESAVERILATAAQFFQDAAVAYARHRIYRSTLTELRDLSDRDLNDLGMNRSMLKSIALQAAEGYVPR